MRKFLLAGVCLLLAGCNETTSQTGPSVASDASYRTTDAQQGELPPIYEPLIDMNRVNPAKYRADLAECRQLAAPQEQAARQARAQQSTGTAIQVASAVASFIPVSTFQQARTLAHATDAAASVGGATADNAAMAADRATADYALVVNTCLGHKRYRILR